MTEYTPAKDELLMALASAIMGGQVDSVALRRLKQAAQSRTEPKFNCVDCCKKLADGTICIYQNIKPLCGLCYKNRIEDWAAKLASVVEEEEIGRTAAVKDSELAAVIADNDKKMAEIERLKAVIEEYRLQACAETRRANDYAFQLNALRNPCSEAAIEAAAERLKGVSIPINVKHASYGIASYIGELTDIGRITVVRAVLNTPGHEVAKES